jgi:hypothetical protein
LREPEATYNVSFEHENMNIISSKSTTLKSIREHSMAKPNYAFEKRQKDLAKKKKKEEKRLKKLAQNNEETHAEQPPSSESPVKE